MHLSFVFSLGQFLLKLFLVLSLYFFLDDNIFTVSWIYVIAVVFTFFINLVLFTRYFPFSTGKTKITKTLSKKILSFNTPLIIKNFFGAFLSHMDNIILIYFRPLTEVAIYNTILPTAELLLFICRPFAKVLFPLSSEMEYAHRDKISSIVKLTHKYLILREIYIVEPTLRV